MKLYHNPRCSKSREGLAMVENAGREVEVVEYMKEALTKEELEEILNKLGMKAEDLVRKNEAIYKEKFKGKKKTNSGWISAMVKYPQLIQRPILIKGDKAVLGRPVEDFKELL